jgi:hypothetical protein
VWEPMSTCCCWFGCPSSFIPFRSTLNTKGLFTGARHKVTSCATHNDLIALRAVLTSIIYPPLFKKLLVLLFCNVCFFCPNSLSFFFACPRMVITLSFTQKAVRFATFFTHVILWIPFLFYPLNRAIGCGAVDRANLLEKIALNETLIFGKFFWLEHTSIKCVSEKVRLFHRFKTSRTWNRNTLGAHLNSLFSMTS